MDGLTEPLLRPLEDILRFPSLFFSLYSQLIHMSVLADVLLNMSSTGGSSLTDLDCAKRSGCSRPSLVDCAYEKKNETNTHHCLSYFPLFLSFFHLCDMAHASHER